MKAEIKFECKNCVEDLTLEITVKQGLPAMSTIREEARKRGWSIGRDCYCPECLSNLPARCETCEHFEGRKSMGSPLCRRDCKFTTANDFCSRHEPIHGYKNPIPSIE